MSEAITCGCGRVRIAVEGSPIFTCECACTSCRTAAEAFSRAGADPRGPLGTTPFVLYRKDRVQLLEGGSALAELRLREGATTRRVVATCCNTPVFLEFERGHWLSLYANLWPAAVRPRATMRTMTVDLPPGEYLPDDLPNARRQSAKFMFGLFRAWVAMGLRVPSIDWVEGGALEPPSTP